MRQIFWHISYRMRISIVITLFALIPLSLFGGYYLKDEWKNWQMSTVEKYSQMLDSGTEQLDNEIQEMQSKLIYVSNIFSIRTALSEIDDMTLIEGLEFVNLLRDTVEPITVGNKFLAVRWYTYHDINYGGYTYCLDELEQEMNGENTLYDEILSLGAGEMLHVVREIDRENSVKDEFQRRFCTYTKITSLRNPDSLLEMSLPLEKLVNMQDSDLPEGSILGIYLELDHGGQIFLISEDTEGAEKIFGLYHRTGNCQGYYPIVSKIDSIPDSQIICLIPKDYVMGQMSGNIITYAMMILLFLLSVVLCSYAASAMLTRRVVHFIEKMNSEVDTILKQPDRIHRDNNDILSGKSMSECENDLQYESGNSDILNIESLSERDNMLRYEGDVSDIWSIESKIRKLMQNTQEYYARLEQAETEKNCLELEILQMRINPHFLYNTLTSIRYQIKEARIRKSIDSLIHYYRIVLSKGHLFIKIEEEMSMVREYLELQIFAYRLENIKYVFEVDENVKTYTIIKHLLQPIVENALEHGLRSNNETGIIWIRARLDGKDIIFEIEDNGVGMSPEQIAHVLSEPEGGSEGGGYGIYNVQQRIEMYYGKGYGIVFQSKKGEGTCVKLRISQRIEEEY